MKENPTSADNVNVLCKYNQRYFIYFCTMCIHISSQEIFYPVPLIKTVLVNLQFRVKNDEHGHTFIEVVVLIDGASNTLSPYDLFSLSKFLRHLGERKTTPKTRRRDETNFVKRSDRSDEHVAGLLNISVHEFHRQLLSFRWDLTEIELDVDQHFIGVGFAVRDENKESRVNYRREQRLFLRESTRHGQRAVGNWLCHRQDSISLSFNRGNGGNCRLILDIVSNSGCIKRRGTVQLQTLLIAAPKGE